LAKKLTVIGASLLGLSIVAALALVFFLDANQFRPTLEDTMSKALGRRVTISNIKVAPFSGGIALEGLAIADDPAFGRDPFVTARAVRVGVDLMPLILSRSLRVESFTLERPEVRLLRSASGVWNASTLGAGSSSSGGSGAASSVSVFVQKITISSGRLLVADVAKPRAQHTYEDVTLDVTNLSYSTPFTVRASAKTPGGGTANLDGQAGPINRQDATATPFQAHVNLTHFDLAATGFVDSASGVRGLADFDGQLTSNGSAMTTKGKATATNMQLVPGGAPARVPVVIDYSSNYDTKTKRGALTQGDVRVGEAAARLTGGYDARGESTVLRMRLVGEKMPVTALEAALPALGVTLPNGASLTQGTMDTDLAIAGPVDRLVITGPLGLSNTTVSGFDLSGKLGALASFAGLPKTSNTLIRTLAGMFRVAPDGIAADALELTVPAIGALTGAGTISPSGAMDFKMLAKLSSDAGATAQGGVARAVAFAQKAGIPFRVGGTTSNPTFAPDLGSVGSNVKSSLADAAKNPDNLEKARSALGSLFNRKK